MDAFVLQVVVLVGVPVWIVVFGWMTAHGGHA